MNCAHHTIIIFKIIDLDIGLKVATQVLWPRGRLMEYAQPSIITLTKRKVELC